MKAMSAQFVSRVLILHALIVQSCRIEVFQLFFRWTKCEILAVLLRPLKKVVNAFFHFLNNSCKFSCQYEKCA